MCEWTCSPKPSFWIWGDGDLNAFSKHKQGATRRPEQIPHPGFFSY